MREIPPIKYSTDVNRLVGYYQRSHLRVVKDLVMLMETTGTERLIAQEASLARQLQLIIHENDKIVLPEVERLIRKSGVSGQAQALLALGEAKTLIEATRMVSMTLLSQKTADKMVADTFEDVLALTNRTDVRIKKTVRDLSGEVLRMNAMNQVGLSDSRKEIMQGLLRKGFSKKVTADFKGVTDSAGRKWKLDKYVKMLVKTKMSQAYSEGVRAESIERGTDLAMISSHGAKDACRHYEGMVISMTGATEGLYTYDELQAGNQIFHPNCEHTITPLSSIELLPTALQEKHGEMLSNNRKR
jgi:hypothetical protein